METAEKTSQKKPDAKAQESPQTTSAPSEGSKLAWCEPDLGFVQALSKQGADSFKKCFQCGTCSATCAISPDPDPFPRKEMAWAAWGMKDRLLKDPDVWLCYQCTDCSTRCPRDARPGDVLAAVRRESVIYYSFPRFVGRWVNEPQSILLMLGVPAALLTVGLLLKGELESVLGFSGYTGARIVYSYSSMLPHWLLNGFFGLICVTILLVIVVGIGRFWRAMSAGSVHDRTVAAPRKGLMASIIAALKAVITHHDFAECTSARLRYWSHLSVFFGFLALSVVTLWVITSGLNPLMERDFVYPFGFWSPWKMLANLGGIALVVGCSIMIRDRLREGHPTGSSTFSDWAFLWLLFIVALTGFATEVLHYVRLEPHRHIAYFVHLVFACALLLYLPYSKFAHLIYRTTAMVFAEYTGRSRQRTLTAVGNGQKFEQQADDQARSSQSSAIAPPVGESR